MKKNKIITLTILGLFLFSSIGFADVLESDNLLETGQGGAYTAVEPTANPVAGNYTSTQSVALTASGSSEIRYTTNGTVPSCSNGNLYSATISVSSTTTIKAISCYLEGDGSYSHSNIASFEYVIERESTPSPSGGRRVVAPPQEASSYTTRDSCLDANFYWYDELCHSTEKVEDDKESEIEKEYTFEGKTTRYYRGQADDLEEQLRRKQQRQSQAERIKTLINVIIVAADEKEDKDTHKEALLSILERVEEMATRLGKEIEELERLLGIVRGRISLLDQLERIERMKIIISRLIITVGENEITRDNLNTFLSRLNDLQSNIEKKLSE